MFRRHLKDRSIRICVATLAVTLAWQGFCTTSSWAQTEKASDSQSRSTPQLNEGAQDGTTNIVAVVNGQSITRQELAQQCMERYGEQVVESLVNKHLILQACKKQGIRITHQDIDNRPTPKLPSP